MSGSFCGDAEVFLDRMLEQCHRRPKGRHPGFGRELVPYFAEGEVMEQHAQYSNVDRYSCVLDCFAPEPVVCWYEVRDV